MGADDSERVERNRMPPRPIWQIWTVERLKGKYHDWSELEEKCLENAPAMVKDFQGRYNEAKVKLSRHTK